MLEAVLALDHHPGEVAVLARSQSMRLNTILRSRSRPLIRVGVGEAEDVEGRLPASIENLAMNHGMNICVIGELVAGDGLSNRLVPLARSRRPYR